MWTVTQRTRSRVILRMNECQCKHRILRTAGRIHSGLPHAIARVRTPVPSP